MRGSAWRWAGITGEGAGEAAAGRLMAAGGELPKMDFNKKYQDRWCGALAARETAGPGLTLVSP